MDGMLNTRAISMQGSDCAPCLAGLLCGVLHWGWGLGSGDSDGMEGRQRMSFSQTFSLALQSTRRPEFPGRNVVFNKTIAGRRRTLLLIVFFLPVFVLKLLINPRFRPENSMLTLFPLLYSLVQWNWISDVIGCMKIRCIQWRQRTNFVAPSCTCYV